MNKIEKCLGEQMKRNQYNGFELSLTKYEPNQLIEFHYHTSPYYSMMIEGGYYEKNEFELAPINAGMLVKRPSEYLHQNIFSNHVSYCFNIEFTEFNEFFPYKELRSFKYGVSTLKQSQINSWKLFVSFLENNPALQVESILLNMIADEEQTKELPKRSAYVNGWLKKIEDYLQSNLEDNVSLKELSNLVNVSPIYMIRAFKSKYGLTIGEYHLCARINNALNILINSKQSISDIAFHAGFYDQSHFTRSFKKLLSVSPNHFRNKLKKFI